MLLKTVKNLKSSIVTLSHSHFLTLSFYHSLAILLSHSLSLDMLNNFCLFLISLVDFFCRCVTLDEIKWWLMIWDEFIARHSYKTYPSQWYLAHALGSVIGCYRYTESTCQNQKVGWQIPSQNIVGVANQQYLQLTQELVSSVTSPLSIESVPLIWVQLKLAVTFHPGQRNRNV